MFQDPRFTEKEEREAWKTAPLSDLVHHIVERYHLEARVEIARLETHAEEAVLRAGKDNPTFVAVRDQVTRLGAEMRAHLTLEEREVFPAILDLAAGRPTTATPEFLEPLKQMLMDEHDAEAGMFRQIRTLIHESTPPEGALPVHEKLYASLSVLAESLQRHIFLENQILFRRT